MTREVCSVHGYVGSAAFLRDRHDLCAVITVGSICRRCQGRKLVTAKFCTWCDGTGLEPNAALVAEEPVTPLKPKRQRRGRRARGLARSRTVAIKSITQHDLAIGRLQYPIVDETRPVVRGDCKGDPRPCPWVGCKHHLYLDINPETGSIKINFPDLEPWELRQTCSLDVADRGGVTLEEVGELTNLTRERVRQIEVKGLLAIKVRPAIAEQEGDVP